MSVTIKTSDDAAREDQALAQAHELLDMLVFAKARVRIMRQERDLLKAQLENAYASPADTDVFLMSKVDSANEEMQTLRSERNELASNLDDAKESLEYAADLMSKLLKDGCPAYVKRRVAEFIRTFKDGAE